MNYIFFLPDGPTLGGVEGWSFAMVRALNEHSPGCARVLSLVEAGKEAELRLYPEDIKDMCTEVVVNVRRLIEQSYFDEILAGLSPLVKEGFTYLFPNYGSHTYALAVGMKPLFRGRVSLVCTLHSDDFHSYALARYFSPSIDRYIAVSSQISRKLKEAMPWRAEEVLMRPCGVENLPQKALAASKFYGLSVAPRICYVGRLASHQKRILDLAKAVELLEQEHFQCHFDVIGDGPEKSDLETEIARIKPSFVKVTFHGRQSKDAVISLLENSHIFCSFSSVEGTSISLMEAMGCGCLPLVTEVSGVRDLISDERFIYQTGDLESFVRKLRNLSSSDVGVLVPYVDEMMRKSRENTLQKYLPWFLESFASAEMQPLFRTSEVYRNWDFTWNPAIFQKEHAHPLFRVYERVKSKWYGRFLINIVQRLSKMIR